MNSSVARVLVADDEPNLREALRLLFERNEFVVLIAEDGQEAVEIAQREQPDVIILDVMMPRMDGYEACRTLRAHYRTRHIPIIMLTAKQEDDDRLAGLAGGANDYVTKPWKSKELVQRVRNHTDFSRSQIAVNPLTGLPGNLSILAERQRRADAGEAFAQMSLDLDSFKAFNDRYGFTRGDKAISAVAEVLVRTVETSGRPGDFVGHIGGDDFCVLTTPDRGESLAEAIKDALDARMPELYDPEDRAAGRVRVRNRRHEFEDFPLMSMTIAVATFDPATGAHLAQLDDVLRELKEFGKGLPGSVVVTERRQNSMPAMDPPYGAPQTPADDKPATASRAPSSRVKKSA